MENTQEAESELKQRLEAEMCELQSEQVELMETIKLLAKFPHATGTLLAALETAQNEYQAAMAKWYNLKEIQK